MHSPTLLRVPRGLSTGPLYYKGASRVGALWV
jgi:hypothetical protein